MIKHSTRFKKTLPITCKSTDNINAHTHIYTHIHTHTHWLLCQNTITYYTQHHARSKYTESHLYFNLCQITATVYTKH